LKPVSYYKNKKVFITGHTGFKGSWMCKVLQQLGAEIYGYSLDPPTQPNLYDLINNEEIKTTIADICDIKTLTETILRVEPDIVIHMAAQPLVSVGYSDPILTYKTNVMGTVNILEAVRKAKTVRSFVNVTTDKVYHNNEWEWGYRENEPLNGYDPYSNSKSCSELVTSCYSNSFFNKEISISTARAGNVIGGGDFTDPRIIPDCVRAAINKRTMILRNPNSTRPYQHVLEPVFAYLMIAAKQYNHVEYASSYNVGPGEEGCINNEQLVKLFGKYWGKDFEFKIQENPNAPHEANYLKLDCSKLKSTFNWLPKWTIDKAVEKTVEWTKSYLENKQMECMDNQIREYVKSLEW